VVKTTLYKTAFTMIELIFAIVIIAIAVLSLPMITRVTSEAIDDNLVQEAIFAGAAELMNATAGYWDENSMEDIDTSHLSRVIDINNNCNLTTRQKPGHIGRRCLDSNTTDANNTAGGTVIDLDDAVKNNALFTNNITNAAGYKRAYQSSITIDNTANPDIKIITSVISDVDGIITRLTIHSANIGEIDPYKRRF